MERQFMRASSSCREQFIHPKPSAAPVRLIADFSDFSSRKSREKRPSERQSSVESIASLWQRSCSILTVSFMSSQITRKLFSIDDCYKMVEFGILPPGERT